MDKEINFKKSMIEKYEIRINGDYAIFTLDKLEGYGWRFNCQSSWGNYSHIWGSPGKSFKGFLIRLNKSYLYDKLCERSTFYPDEYIRKCKSEIIRLRKDWIDGIDKEDARSLWTFFDEEINAESCDLVVDQLCSNNTLYKMYGGEIFNTDFMPDKTYSYNQRHFIEKIYPIFTDILKRELEQKEAI